MDKFFNLDKTDKKIIAALEQDSRQPNKAIAKKAGVNEHIVAYRIQRLLEEGVVKKIYCIVNRGALFNVGYRTFLRFQNLSTEKEKGLVKRAVECKYTCWVSLCRGHWDMVISMFVDNPNQFMSLFSKIISGYEEFIQEKEIVNYLELIDFNRTHVYGGDPMAMAEYDGKSNAIEIDELDQKILEQLSTNSRLTLIEMSKQFLVSPDTIRNRINGLEEKKVILGHGVLFDLKKIGIGYYVMLLNLKSLSKARQQSLYNFALQHSSIMCWIKTIGAYDLNLDVEIEEQKLDALVAELRNKFGDVIKNIEILTIKDEFKYTSLTQK